MNARGLPVRVVDQNGGLIATTLVVDNGVSAEPPYTLLGHADVSALLAGWRGADGTVRVARLTCD